MENPTGRRDITNNTFIDVELNVCEGNTQLPDLNEPIENAFTSRKTTRSQAKSEFVVTSNVEENVASFSPCENNENILNTEAFESTSTQYSSNFEPSRKCAFGCVGIIIIICSSVVPLIADVNLHNRQAHNATFLNDTNWQHRIDARLVAYCFEMFLTPVALVYLLYIYYSCVLKSDRITRSVLIDGDLDYAIKQIKELSLNVSRLQKTSKQRLQLVYAHRYASIYVFCCMSFGLAYLWYVRTWASAISNDFFFKFLGHFLAYGGLVCVMWKTNAIIDRMKETVLLVGSSGHPRIRNINLHDREKALFALAVERCQLYAFLYYRKVSLPGVLVAILPGAASLLLRYVNRRLHLYELFSDKV